MAVPKFRTSKSKRNMRRSHHALKVPGFSLCANCQAVKASHAVCEACGHHKGRQVVEPRVASGLDHSFDTEN